jgi:hypothetical protein
VRSIAIEFATAPDLRELVRRRVVEPDRRGREGVQHVDAVEHVLARTLAALTDLAGLVDAVADVEDARVAVVVGVVVRIVVAGVVVVTVDVADALAGRSVVRR